MSKALEELKSLNPAQPGTPYPFPPGPGLTGWRVYRLRDGKKTILAADGVYHGWAGRTLYRIRGEWRSVESWAVHPGKYWRVGKVAFPDWKEITFIEARA